MEKQKTKIYQKALDEGIVKEGDYFSVQYPDGREVLFRLVKRKGRYVMWGMKTTKGILLKENEVYDNFLTLANSQVRKEYSSEEFEEVHALGLSKPDYESYSEVEFRKILDEARKMCENSEDANIYYTLASLCVDIYATHTRFYVFHVDGGNVGSHHLDYCREYYSTYEARPEAIPKPTMRIYVNKRNGSRENPWICLNKSRRCSQ